MIEVLVSYASGTTDMLGVCLSSIARHDAGADMTVVVLAGDNEAYAEAVKVGHDFSVEVRHYDSTGAKTSSGRHARMLDAAVADCKHEHVLTLDSDCFPMADGWLGKLVDLGKGACVSGILWPWVPPPVSVGRNTIEWKIRSQHNWERTQVACQLVRTSFLRDMKLKFGDPDGTDNNFGLMDKVFAKGWKVAGLMPTRCALPDEERLDPEFNRHVCVVFGDLIYHHGGASRETKGEFYVDKSLFGSAREMVFREKGAEFLLGEGRSHKYAFDKEEEVAQFKMRMMYDDAVRMLSTSKGGLFGGNWV